MAAHSGIPACRIKWTKEAAAYSTRAGHDWGAKHSTRLQSSDIWTPDPQRPLVSLWIPSLWHWPLPALVFSTSMTSTVGSNFCQEKTCSGFIILSFTVNLKVWGRQRGAVGRRRKVKEERRRKEGADWSKTQMQRLEISERAQGGWPRDKTNKRGTTRRRLGEAGGAGDRMCGGALEKNGEGEG